jgi:excisionase family DNA binding protein
MPELSNRSNPPGGRQEEQSGTMKLTPKKAAERVGVSVSLVYEWCQDKRVPHYRCGGRGRRGRILIEDADLDAFLTTLRVEARPGGVGLPALKHINLP